MKKNGKKNGNDNEKKSGYAYLKETVAQLEDTIKAKDKSIEQLRDEIEQLENECTKIKTEHELDAMQRACKIYEQTRGYYDDE